MISEIQTQLWQQLMNGYNSLLRDHPLYIKHVEALVNWEEIQASRTGICSKCFVEAKTHFHHKDKTLIPEILRSIPLEIWYVPVKDIMYSTLSEIIENVLKKFEIEKNIAYFGVSKKNVVELCPTCHRKEHKKQ